MFKKILIANRGEIASRIARTCRCLGIAVAGVHSEADRDARHVRDLGESVLLGPAPARESYLSIERVVEAARRVGADAVHPGYGFLSENAAFAEALEAAGIAFVGPTPQALRDFGDKARAKRLAVEAGVPVIPGSTGASDDPARIAQAVREVGFPVLLKAAAGGGGKGIRVLKDDASLADDIAGAMREGLGAFGDGALLVERWLAGGRHVEVQILGDGRGEVLHLFERECSLQRRHQKVIEEAPALALPEALRRRLLDAAVALGRHVRYRALGTVEFLVAGDAFHFLEVNPRLQVEHPVTEAVTGLDLVELQLRAAAGEPLGLAQRDVRCGGHAIEARVYAEDAEAGFLPSTGTLHAVELPPAPARVECGVAPGSVVTSHYDPMLAKVIASGPDRAQALAALRTALAATRLAGVTTNIGFLEALLRSPAVAGEGALPDTGTIDRLLAEGVDAPAPWRAAAPHVAAAWALQRTRRDDAEAPVSAWTSFLHWRLGAPAGHRPRVPTWDLQRDGASSAATIAGDAGGSFVVEIDGTAHRIAFDVAPPPPARIGESSPPPAGPARVTIDGVATPLWLGAEGEHVWLSDGRRTERVRVRPALARERSAGAGAAASLVAPLTGKVLEVRVREGDAVEAGQVLVVVESMKMELRVTAPHAGTVAAVAAAVGAMVERGAELARVDGTRSSA